MMDEAIALCRVSTAKQKEEGSSLEAQEQRVYNAAQFVQATIVKMWSLDISSRKGKNFKRRDLHEMLAYARRHKRVRYAIVDEVDRFMRSMDEFYFWKVRFREEAGVRLVYAAKPQLTFKDDIYAVFEEMIDVFRAEASNQERITKVRDKMQARVQKGYYPFRPNQGYRATGESGLHEPDPARFPLLRQAILDVLSREYTPTQALKRLNNAGYTTPRGNRPLDIDKFMKILRNPYYAGAIRIAGWPHNDTALHTPMIMLDEYEQLQGIINGRVKKFERKTNNPAFPLNRTPCTPCIGQREGMLVGYVHTNGKGWRRPEYRCRRCRRYNPSDKVHAAWSEVLARTMLTVEARRDFIIALRQVWQREQHDRTRRLAVLAERLEHLKATKVSLVEALTDGANSDLREDLREAITKKKDEISSIEQEIERTGDDQQDLVTFIKFALDYVTKLQESWWELSPETRQQCKDLVFPAGFSIDPESRVCTPEISPFFRLASNKKEPAAPNGGSDSFLVNQVTESLHLIIEEARRWRDILGDKLGRLGSANTNRST